MHHRVVVTITHVLVGTQIRVSTLDNNSKPSYFDWEVLKEHVSVVFTDEQDLSIYNSCCKMYFMLHYNILSS
jgi:hypothetical protein